MPIPESRLESWSHRGAVVTSQATHKAVRRALRKWDDLANRNYEVYLQGSYKNYTNIRGDSDVDVVAQINDVFYSNMKALPQAQFDAHEKAYDPATYKLEHFRTDVLNALRKYFGPENVVEGDKSIKILKGYNRLPSDVVVCAIYRKYSYFYSKEIKDSVEGITFFTRKSQRQIINFPKPHYRNGVQKNSGCSISYKAGVRIFKNARNELMRRRWLLNSTAPSYFLECFAYNAANHRYSGSWQHMFDCVLRDLSDGNYSDYMCQNGVVKLFGSSPEQWNTTHAEKLVRELRNLWNNWDG